MRLEEYSETLAYEVAFWAQGLTNPKYPLAEMGALSLDLSRKLRALAIMALVVGGSTDSFCHNLIRSGLGRLAYLKRLQASGQRSDHHWCSARYEPFLDALAAGDFALAREIIALSPSEFRDGHEYEDDYSYAQILSCWVAQPSRDSEVPGLLDRFAQYVEDQPNARLAVCRALAARDQTAFDEAFADVLLARDLEIEAAKTRGQLEEPHVVALRRVFVEGLAILRMAELRGLSTEREYRYCPSLAREPMRMPFPGE
jgi:hypothetical protein